MITNILDASKINSSNVNEVKRDKTLYFRRHLPFVRGKGGVINAHIVAELDKALTSIFVITNI